MYGARWSDCFYGYRDGEGGMGRGYFVREARDGGLEGGPRGGGDERYAEEVRQLGF